MFDENAFLNTTQGAGSTKYPVIPEGSGWVGVSKKIAFREFTFQDKETGQDRTVTIMSLVWEVEDPKLEQAIGSRKANVNQEFWLDFKEDGKSLDDRPGKNTKLSQLREEYGQNVPGWNPRHLLGKSAMLDVTHQTSAKTGETYAQVIKAKKI